MLQYVPKNSENEIITGSKKEAEKIIWCKLSNSHTIMHIRLVTISIMDLAINTIAESGNKIQLVSSSSVPGKSDIHKLEFPGSVG